MYAYIHTCMYIYIYLNLYNAYMYTNYTSMRMSRFLPGMQIKVVVPAHHANYCQQVGCFSVDILGTFDDNTMMGIGIDIHNCHFF